MGVRRSAFGVRDRVSLLTQQLATEFMGEHAADLRDRLSRGDAQAFDDLVDAYYAAVSRFVQRLTAWEMDWEEIVQEVFFVAWRKARSYRGDASPLAWLRKIALNECRRRYRRVRLWRVWKAGQASREPPVMPGADEPMLGRERIEAVRRAIRALPQRDREVIVLHYLEQQDIGQIAEQLGMRRNTVEVRLHRARQRLKPELQTFFEGDAS